MNVYRNEEKFNQYLKNKQKSRNNLYKTYVMFNESVGLYKIGRSIKPKERLKAIEKKHPNTKLLIVIDGLIEIQLHNKFKNKLNRYAGEREWFNLSDDDISYLERISKYNRISVENIFFNNVL